jgi:hypothetical protein
MHFGAKIALQPIRNTKEHQNDDGLLFCNDWLWKWWIIHISCGASCGRHNIFFHETTDFQK